MNSPQLLTGGKAAFPEILRLIKAARTSVEINMFIWRADTIGCAIADALLDAADRGVKVDISVDRYGFVLEKCEECMNSFFHERPTLSESIKIGSLKLLYPELHPKKPMPDTHTELLARMLVHRNISISRDVFKADHSKYYIFDGEVLLLGGINIEDKENGADISGRVYGDYMVKLEGSEYVKAFRDKLNTGIDADIGLRFSINRKTNHRAFEMHDVYLDIINSAERELVIVMAYFSPLGEFVTAITEAALRGVDVKVMIPKKANFQNDLNRRTVHMLKEKSGGRAEVFLSEKMLHTKLMYSEKTLSLGSTNITRKAFGQLDELNLTLDADSPTAAEVKADIAREMAAAVRAESADNVRYRRLMAWLEGFVV